VAAFRLPGWLPRAGGEPARPWVALCMSLESGKVVPTEPRLEDDVPALLTDAVIQAARKWRSRPARIQVADGAGTGALKGLLAPFGVAVETRSELPELSRVMADLLQDVRPDNPRPGPLTGAGVTPERLAAFARAAAGFLAVSGWRHLSHEDRVRIEAPEAVADLRCFVLDHNGGGTAPELHFFAESKGLPLDFEAGDP
jgi:uncharacterized protein DUF6930